MLSSTHTGDDILMDILVPSGVEFVLADEGAVGRLQIFDIATGKLFEEVLFDWSLNIG